MIWLALLLTLQAHAAPAPETWVQRQLGGHIKLDLPGETPERRPCTVGLTDREYGNYFVTVWLDDERRGNDDYIGIVTNQSKTEFERDRLTFRSDQPWGNASRFNNLEIDLDERQNAIRVKGESDLRQIICLLQNVTS